MGHAFIEGDDSHRQSKKFKQRLKYRLDLGYGYEEAFRLATIKEITSQPGLRLLSSRIDLGQSIPSSTTNEILPFTQDNSSNDFLCHSGRDESRRNSSQPKITRLKPNPFSPTQDEIRQEVEKLKSAGLMTEIPTRTNFVASVQTGSYSASSLASSDRPNLKKSDSSDLGARRAPYWIVASLACCWLVYSMTTSLPGHWFWNLLIAVAFEFTPMLILGAKVEPRVQKTAFWGALAIFLIGLGLYLAPSMQMLVNESAAYDEASDRYAGEMTNFHSKAENSRALVDVAKADADRSAQSYEDAVKNYGEDSWRTAAAKKQKVSDAIEWKRLSSDAEIAKAPISPKISDDLTKAAQAIATRIGLFAVVFLSMFVMRRLEGPETA